MANTGILLRRNTKASLLLSPPVIGEMVFAYDTGEHGWLNNNNILVWKDLSIDQEGTDTVYDDTVLAAAVALNTAKVNTESPIGGTTGQLLSKVSDADRDVSWIDVPVGGPSIVTVLSPVSNAQYYDNDYDMLTINLDTEKAMRYNISIKTVGNNEHTFNGLLILPANSNPITAYSSSYARFIGPYLSNGRKDNNVKIESSDDESWIWRVSQVGSEHKLFLHNTGNIANVEITIVYDIIESASGITDFLRYFVES